MQTPSNEVKKNRLPIIFPLPLTLSNIGLDENQKVTPRLRHINKYLRLAYPDLVKKMLPGDLVEDTVVSGFRMSGVYIVAYDGKLMNLASFPGNYGTIPPCFHFIKDFDIGDIHLANEYKYDEKEHNHIKEQLKAVIPSEESVYQYTRKKSYWHNCYIPIHFSDFKLNWKKDKYGIVDYALIRKDDQNMVLIGKPKKPDFAYYQCGDVDRDISSESILGQWLRNNNLCMKGCEEETAMDILNQFEGMTVLIY